MITTERLTLRTATQADAAFIAREISNPQVQQWLTAPPHPYTLENAEYYVAHIARDEGFFLIEDAGGPVGFASIRPRREPGEDVRDLGYWLAVDAHGKGYMTEAATAALDWYFAQGEPYATSGWLEGNGASENVLTKLGFAKTGTIEQTYAQFHGREMPNIRVRLDRATWEARRC